MSKWQGRPERLLGGVGGSSWHPASSPAGAERFAPGAQAKRTGVDCQSMTPSPTQKGDSNRWPPHKKGPPSCESGPEDPNEPTG